jgi:trehalose/maltose transport system substrate-binding protein
MKKFKKTVVSVIILMIGLGVFASEKTVTITMACSSVGNEVKDNKYQIEQFEKEHPNIKVKLNVISNSSDDKLGFYLQLFESRSSNIDVLILDNVWIGDMAENLLDLSKYDIDGSLKGIFPEYLKNGKYNDTIVAVPWFVDAPFLYYRKDLLKKYNLEVPKTWIELTKTAYKIQQGERAVGNEDIVGFLWQGSMYEGLTCCALEWIASNGGGDIINQNKVITVDNPNAVKALTIASRWIGTISPKGVLSMTEEEVRNSFQSGNAVFMRNWPYAYELCQDKGSNVKGEIGVTSLPAGTSGKSASTLGGGSLAVNKYSKHPKEAVEFIKFMTSVKAEKYRAMQGAQFPSQMSLFKDKDVLSKQPYYPELYKIIMSGVNRPSTAAGKNYNRVSKAFYTAVYSVLNGDKTASLALKELSVELSKITGYKIGK